MSYVIRRTAGTIVLVWVIVTLTFLLTSFTSAETVAANLLGSSAAPEQIQQTIERLGLDRPVLNRYLDWIGGVLGGDFGTSWFTNVSVAQSIGTRFPVTLLLLAGTLLVSIALSLLIGVVAAVRGGLLDRVLQFLVVLGFALPNIVVAIALIFFFALQWRLFPATGYVPPSRDVGQWLLGLVLPTLALSTSVVANVAQQVRGAMVDELDQGYVRTLRSRGLSAGSVITRHVLRNAMPPALHAMGIQVIFLASGAVLIERIFALPGMGTLITDATLRGDVPVVLGVVVFFVLLVVVVNLVIDLLAALLTPKVRTA